MSYDRKILFHNISLLLEQNPSISLGVLSREPRVSRRTIQKIINLANGKSFRGVREEIFLTRVKSLFISEPSLAIKALSFSVGYESPRSFGRAVRRACGFSPEELRSLVAEEVLGMREIAAIKISIATTL